MTKTIMRDENKKPPVIHYVLGLMFSSDLSRVLLIRKNKPAWQAGRLNGIGGKVEPGDRNCWSAMRREFAEETGLKTKINDWSHFCTMNGPDFVVDCFAAVWPADLAAARSMESEPLEVWSVSIIQVSSSQDNLPWLIHLALDHLQDGRPDFVTAKYSEWPVKASKQAGSKATKSA